MPYTGFSGLSVGGNSIYDASSASVGVGVRWISSITIPVVALTIAATKSTETTYAFPGLAVTDHVLVTPVTSSLSDGVVLTGNCAAVNVVTLRYSNVSALVPVQTAHVVRASAIRFA